MKDDRLKNCPECGSDEVEVLNDRSYFVHCYRCGNDEYAPTETEAVEKWNFLAKLKAKLQAGEITVSEAEHEYHDRYLKD